LNLTFLNAAFLFGALVALLPLLIHLFSRRRVRTVDFSSLRFLRELERRKIRRVRVRQILLLIVRSLILLCIALALARPTLRGALATGGGRARTSVAIVLDASGSMSRARSGGEEERSLFEDARSVALEVAGLMDEGDQAFLVSAAAPARSLIPGGTFSRTTLSDAILGLEPGPRSTDYRDALETALELLSGARNLNREIYVIGDLQRTGWAGAVRAVPDDAPAVYLFAVDGSVRNLGVASVAAGRRYGGAEGLYSVTVEVQNGGARGAEVPVRLFVDGVQVGRAGVDLPAGERGNAQFSVSVDESEWHSGWAELPADALEFDNRRYFTIPPVRRLEILVVRADGDGGRDDAYYVGRALDPDGRGHRFRTSVIESSSLPAQDPMRFPAVVLADVGRLGGPEVEWLRRYVSDGGGVLAVLGDKTDVRYWNGGELPGSNAVPLVEPFHQASGLRLAPSGRGHPLLEGLVFGERLIDDIVARRGFVAEVTGVEEVLEFPGVGPALLIPRGSEGASGEVAVLLTGVDPEWSDLSRSGFIVPLLHRVVEQISGRGSPAEGVLVGDDLASRLPGSSGGRAQVTLPDGSVSIPEHLGGPGGAVVHRDAEQLGVYVFSRGDTDKALGVVNHDPDESHLSAASRSDISTMLSGLGHQFMDPSSEVADRVMEARRGRELWRALVYAALALLAFEMYLARHRSG